MIRDPMSTDKNTSKFNVRCLRIMASTRDFFKMEFAGSGKPIKLISVDADYSKTYIKKFDLR